MEQRQRKSPAQDSPPPDPQPALFAVEPLPDEENAQSELGASATPSPDLVFDTVPIIEVTAQLVDALERGDAQAKVYVEKLLEEVR